jgi:hypothetical protein
MFDKPMIALFRGLEQRSASYLFTSMFWGFFLYNQHDKVR